MLLLKTLFKVNLQINMGDRDSCSGRVSYRVNRPALAQTKQRIREKSCHALCTHTIHSHLLTTKSVIKKKKKLLPMHNPWIHDKKLPVNTIHGEMMFPSKCNWHSKRHFKESGLCAKVVINWLHCTHFAVLQQEKHRWT